MIRIAGGTMMIIENKTTEFKRENTLKTSKIQL